MGRTSLSKLSPIVALCITVLLAVCDAQYRYNNNKAIIMYYVNEHVCYSISFIDLLYWTLDKLAGLVMAGYLTTPLLESYY